MGFISGNLKSTRFTITAKPDVIDFELLQFTEITPGSLLRERSGFLPFDLYEDGTPHYQLDACTCAFRFRTDTVIIDQGLVKEKMQHHIRLDAKAGMPASSRRRRQLRILIEEELMKTPAVKTRVIEGIIHDNVIYLDTVAKGQIGMVLEYLNKIGVEVEFLTPWGSDEGDLDSGIDLKEPGQSVHGCEFLRQFINDPEVLVEPEKGSIKLVTDHHATVTLTGEVLGDLDHYLENNAKLLVAKVLFEEYQLNFDALGFRIKGINLPKGIGDYWTGQLMDRLDRLKVIWELLDSKYAEMGIT